jgi:hypothetical protein
MTSPAIAVMIPTQSGPPLAVVKPNTTATPMMPTPAPASDSPTFLSPLDAIEALLPRILQGHSRRWMANPSEAKVLS